MPAFSHGGGALRDYMQRRLVFPDRQNCGYFSQCFIYTYADVISRTEDAQRASVGGGNLDKIQSLIGNVEKV
ncbi:MAG TPA: hypothetical protein VGE56_04475, partial [Rhodocyclaceae bacterium]